jgi:hypothetical protein
MLQIHNPIQENNNDTIVKDINECIVCMELLDEPNSISVKCKQCIYEWCLKCHEKLEKCPYCRHPFESLTIHSSPVHVENQIVQAQLIRFIIFILILFVLGFQLYLFSGILLYVMIWIQMIF